MGQSTSLLIRPLEANTQTNTLAIERISLDRALDDGRASEFHMQSRKVVRNVAVPSPATQIHLGWTADEVVGPAPNTIDFIRMAFQISVVTIHTRSVYCGDTGVQDAPCEASLAGMTSEGKVSRGMHFSMYRNSSYRLTTPCYRAKASAP